MASVAEDFLHLVDLIESRAALPRVRCLLMPKASDARGKDAEFCALELEDGSFGLSYVWLGNTFESLLASLPGMTLENMDARALARWYADPDPIRRTLGFAAVNAISQSLFRRAGYVPPDASDSLGALAPERGDHIGMVGLFPPLIDPVVASGARLTVLELRPELAVETAGYRVTLDPGEIAACNKIVSTSTILLNDTLDAVLAACRDADAVSLVGPTASCLPDPLFARGVDAVGGTQIVDADGFRAALAQGGKWGASARKYVISAGTYPGTAALLRRACEAS